MKRSLIQLAFIGLALTSTLSAEQVKKYNVRLHRPSEKGEKYQTEIKVNEQSKQTVTVGGKEVQSKEETLVASLSGLIEVTAVDEEGEVDKIKLTVEEGSFQQGEDAAEEMKKGTVIEGVRKDGKKTYTVNGKVPGKELQEILGKLLGSKDSKEEMTGDKAFGTDVPRAVGSEWDVDIALLCKSMPESVPLVLSEEKSEGTVKFEKVKKDEGTEWAQLLADLSLEVEGMKGVPEGTKVTKGSMKIKLKGVVPTDESSPGMAGANQMELKIDFVAEIPTPEGKPAVMEIVSKMTKEETNLPAE